MKVKTILRSTSFYVLAMAIAFCFASTGVVAQTKTVTGVVSEKSGATLPGVNVLIKGTTNGTTTDIDGKFSLNASDNDVLVFSFIGYATQEVPVDGKKVINVTLVPDVVALDEVVAIGYGTQKKKDLTSAIGSVSSEDFEAQPVTEISQALQGRTAGVSVVKASGAPGGTTKIRVRGSNSITGGNDPLYVIDGLVGGDFASLNPNDIEDIQILKDASATAIYGSRGANGVVIVTTKSGKRGENKISFRANYSVSEVIKKWDLLSAGQYAEVANEYNTALGNSPVFTEEEVAAFYQNGGTDWQDEVLRVAQGQDYQLTVAGGGDKATYYVSGSYLDQDGIVINSGYKRYGIRANISSNLMDKLKATVRTNFSHRESLNNGGGGDKRNALNQMLNWAPTTPAYDEFGNINPKDYTGSFFENPLEVATNTYKYVTNNFTANGNLVYTFMPGLTLDVGLGVRYNSGFNKVFVQGLLMGLTSEDAASATRGGNESTYLANTNVLTYKKLFNDKHDLTITLVNEQTKEVYDNFSVTANGLLFPVFQYHNLSLLTENGKLQGNAWYGERKIRSYVGRATYVFDNKYLLSASIRRDGSSVFRGDNVWSNFPSLSAGWTISEEDFFESDAIDNLKLRASWGKTGNQAVGIYGTQGQLRTSPPRAISTSFENGQATAGLIMGDPGNQDLKWETTEQINLGLDVSLFNRVTFTADYFKKNTYDLLLYMPIPSYAGGGGMNQNVGEVENKGWEFALNADVIDNGEWSWSSNFNASFLNNKILKLGREEFGMGSTGGTEGYEFVVREGAPIASFYGLTYLGTWKEDEADLAAVYNAVPGDAKFKDLQKEGEEGYGVIDSNDKDIIGNGIPKGNFGWNNTVKYKNFTLNVFMQAMTGFDRWAFTYAQAVTPGMGSNNVEHADILKRWDAETNPNSDIPHFSSTTRTDLLTSRFVMDASYLRLKNLSLSYQFDLGGSRTLTLMAAGTNLLTITNYKGLDPEAFTNNGGSDALSGVDVGAYPNSKMYSLTATINF